MRPGNLMDPYIYLNESKGEPQPQGPAHKFEGGSGRTRCLMEPHINLKEGQGDSETFMDPYISLQKGQRDQETSWTRTSM